MNPVTVLEPSLLRSTFGCFPSGVTAVATMIDGQPDGMAASSFTSVSLDPPLVSVCVDRGSSTWVRLREAGRLGVSVLGGGHDLLCRQLASKNGDRFAGVPIRTSEDGAVFIEEASGWFECTLEEELPAGDHVIALLRIHALGSSPEIEPLVFHASAFRRLEVLEVVEERAS
jgi:flavin reductase (DIM6/NTAB) family NADH-FMN oxidoreductase RutF